MEYFQMKTNLKALRLAVKRGLQKLGEFIWMNRKAERQLFV